VAAVAEAVAVVLGFSAEAVAEAVAVVEVLAEPS